ncbi:hybrid sensor histidine kinase/response regulator [Biostraticola tofi]|uniref:histidine kinase n=1 Tax=Biostraticola tofi TaxID=466109 RepID=A0A4R3YVH5_9GAMM|nr:hybrid sensor histidine kinase/response regulator [Biostraticola tofi]TCV95223.1 signal transduction histidine kinase [Biostraticola tofi]
MSTTTGFLLDDDRQADGISQHNQVLLLGMSLERALFSVTAIPFVGITFIIWLYHLGGDIRPFLVWFVFYAVAALLFRLLFRRWREDLQSMPDHLMLSKWRGRVHLIALLNGLALSSSVWITAGKAPQEYVLLLVISIAAILAANATHLTPNLGTFKRFLFSCWGSMILATPWLFGPIWGYVLPLILLYGVAMYRFGLSSNRFFINQVKFEEREKRLAESFRLAKEQAEKALRDKNHFLAAASHDLRQPIHAMGFLIEAIVGRSRDAHLTRLMRDLRQCVQSATAMFDSLMDLSRIENGVVATRRMPVRLLPLFDDLERMFREETHNRGLTLRIRRPPSDAYALGDETLIRRAIVNLIHNGLRYTETGGVLVGARKRGFDWQLDVWDTGVGIADGERTKIYSAFYRNEYAWGIDNAGHGLGLAVVARCATLMAVTHGMNSIAGRGSRFWLRLPRTEPLDNDLDVTLEPSSNDYASVHFSLLSGSCLVVDDDPLVIKAWESLIASWGVDVRCAASARETFAVLDSGFVPEAILCDQRLRSGESGFDILVELLSRFPDASGAMVSGDFKSEILHEAEENGYLVLRKPLPPAQLHALLAQWLQPGEESVERGRKRQPV